MAEAEKAAEMAQQLFPNAADAGWLAAQAERDKFSRNFDILKLAVENTVDTAAPAATAIAAATTYKEWMDKQ